MARADLLKKLFSSFKVEDREAFLRVAEEIIEDERKKNHGILANELKTIISTGTSFPKRSLSTFLRPHQKQKTMKKLYLKFDIQKKHFLMLSSHLKTDNKLSKSLGSF